MIRRWQGGDIATSGTQFDAGENETAQSVRYRLKMFLGENFLDASDGTPWFQSILGKTPQELAEINLKERILNTPRVVGIQRMQFSTDRNQRKITVSATVLDIDSQLVNVGISEDLV